MNWHVWYWATAENNQSQQRDILERYILSFGRQSSEAELREETNNTGNKLQFYYVNNTFFSSAVLIEEYVPSNRLYQLWETWQIHNLLCDLNICKD